MTFFPDMSTFLTIGSLRITWYAIIILSGALIAYYVSLKQIRKWGYKDEVFENFFIIMLPIAIIGARLYYVIFEWGQYADNPISALYIWNGGLAIHGGLIAAILFGFWYFKRQHINVLRIADAVLPNVMLAQAIGRWGNFMNQEAYGQVVSSSFYKGWPSFIKETMYIDGAYRQPTFLFESIGNIIGFILITFVYKKYGRKKRGDLAWAYVTWYGMVRVIVESMRTDSLMIGPIRVAQLISILMIVIGIMGITGVFDKLFKNVWPFKKNKPAVIFDLDGTLVDTKDLIYQSFIHTFAKYKPEYQLSDVELSSFLGPTLQQSFSKYFEESQLDEIIAYYRAFNHEHHDELVKEIPHAREVLETLKQEGYPLAVMSNKIHEIVVMGLKQCKLDTYFDVVLGGEDIPEAKPDPSGIIKACELLYVPIDDVVYVGDSTTDILACKRMSAFSVGFVYEEDRAEEMRKEKPCVMIHDMREILTVLKEDHEWSDVTI